MYSSTNHHHRLLLILVTVSFSCLLQVTFVHPAMVTADYLDNSITSDVQQNPEIIENNENFVNKYYFDECFRKKLKLSCLTEKATQAVENSMDIDLQLIPGLVLARNDLPVLKYTSSRDAKSGIDRLTTALSNFMDSHSLTVEHADEARRRRRRRFGLLLTALLGAFGITNAMMLKGIGLIAGKALMVSKMALMIIGIIGLKKLFQKDEHHEPQVVQVHTLHDEHDRNVNSAMYNIRHL